MARTWTWLGLTLILAGCETAKTPPASPPGGASQTLTKPVLNLAAPPTGEQPTPDAKPEKESPADEPAPRESPPSEPTNKAAEPPAPALPENGDSSAHAAPQLPSQAVELMPEEIAEGWIRLFDGESLFGWKPNSELNWRVENGVIVADVGQPGLLQTTSRFADFELRCDVRVAAGGNSGIFLRTAFTPTDPAVDCYELNICDTHPAFKSGSLVKRAQPTKEIAADGDWHSFHVRAEGPHISVLFDGERILDYVDDSPAPLVIGHIGLQMNGGKAEFKNVFVKPLGAQPLFDGNSLSGWHAVDGSKSQFAAEDGAIHVTGGRGFLETDATAKNFVLQFEAKTNGEKLNSGVFFRAMPGTESEPSNGYEFQIHNGYKDGDRSRPEDFGTGAIFRRAPARKVVSNDREWFSATLIADGPHFATWVNGEPVVDWTDDRPSDDNPRKGLRLDAGHFSLQGHDPGTDVQFRNLRLVRLPE